MSTHRTKILSILLAFVSVFVILGCGGGGGTKTTGGGTVTLNQMGTGGTTNNGTITGKVLEEGSLNPISGAIVFGGGKATTTSSDGSYTLSGVPAGTITLSAYKSGYAGIVSMTANASIFTFELQKTYGWGYIQINVTVTGAPITWAGYSVVDSQGWLTGGMSINNGSGSSQDEVTPGNCTVAVYAEGKVIAYSNITVGEGETKNVNLTLEDATSNNSGSLSVNLPQEAQSLYITLGTGQRSSTNLGIFLTALGTLTNPKVIQGIPAGSYWANFEVEGGSGRFANAYTSSNFTITNGQTTNISLAWPAFISAPVLTSPSDEESEVGITPTLTWDPVSGADAYFVLIEDDQQNDIIFAVTNSASFTFPQVPTGVPGLQIGQTYKWRVLAFDWENFNINNFVFSSLLLKANSYSQSRRFIP